MGINEGKGWKKLVLNQTGKSIHVLPTNGASGRIVMEQFVIAFFYSQWRDNFYGRNLSDIFPLLFVDTKFVIMSSRYLLQTTTF